MNEQLDELKSVEGAIEAILYAAGYPVKYEKIAEVLGLDVRNTKRLIEHMAGEFNSEKSKRGINLLCFEDTCQFCTKEQYAPYIREALGIRRGGNLSASSMEVTPAFSSVSSVSAIIGVSSFGGSTVSVAGSSARDKSPNTRKNFSVVT